MIKFEPEFAEQLIRAALEEARCAQQEGEVPIGAVIGLPGEKRIVARAHNRVEQAKDPTAHAEVLALRSAGEILGDWRLEECVLGVTLEPCTMCIGAIKLARIPVIVFGAHDPRLGACGSLYDLSIDSRNGVVPRMISGVCEAECGAVLSRFFEGRR